MVAYRKRAFYRQESGDSRGAIDDYSHVIESDPKDVQSLRRRGYARLQIHEFDAAIADLSAAIALNPKDGQAYSLRGLAYEAKRDTKRADLDFATMRQLDAAAR